MTEAVIGRAVYVDRQRIGGSKVGQPVDLVRVSGRVGYLACAARHAGERACAGCTAGIQRFSHPALVDAEHAPGTVRMYR